MTIRDAATADFAQILALNHAHVHFLSPLDADRLALLHAQAAYHRVSAESDAVVGAFLLALREGQSYDSPNYRWFASRYPHFLYIDRIVIATTQQRHGLGRLLYDDLLAFARTSGVGVVACEIDEDPPNPTSMRFHAARGFREVGSQVVGLRRKRVSLQTLALGVSNVP
ncbi:MAG: GNAT family N-acetyltransferase [Rhodoferax sp.]|nr:GNAT family N-acetyltransferase [Rhodoferax sp.]MBP9931211.1 GNAT family N-acetyltransferase [Rhodoferax sp.]HQX58299.1 GNAT family N-acetyltransferase [Burkholderiaceae bacterium]HQZ08023.1 GNAT family N-acetyltransferase [Burkholderiaceae bacterium]HRA62201.1 GNAT family N-acetyltransferase [Burkholderiaceae bacterium]